MIPDVTHENIHGNNHRFTFRCDDNNGYLLDIVWSMDGDLHLSIQADPDHPSYKSNLMHISGSVRLRVPFIGGGRYHFLHTYLIDGLRKEWERLNEASKPKIPVVAKVKKARSKNVRTIK
jgi:hypothetical protein